MMDATTPKPTTIGDDGDDSERAGRRFYTAIYRVRHGGQEIGQTEQIKGELQVEAQLLDRRAHVNQSLGHCPTHEAAAKTIIKEWERRNTTKAAGS